MLQQKIKRFILGFLIISGFNSVVALADCPAPASFAKQYGSRPQDYEWVAPGFEAFPPDHADHGDTAVSRFLYTVWWHYKNDPNGGAVFCVYAGDKGSIITATQTTEWGQIAKPTDGPWTPFTYEGYDAVMCKYDITACHFLYD